MSETTTNFLGIPIDGDINRAGDRKTQRPREEFEAIITTLLDDPFFVEFGWTQYTPYFNDGDPCTFDASGFWIRTESDGEPRVDSEDDEDDYDEDDTDRLQISYTDHPTLGTENGYPIRVYVGTRESQYRVACAASDAVEGGEFDDVLLGLFGDHAAVKVTRSGITVDEYSHD